jgi:hypothetical protein
VWLADAPDADGHPNDADFEAVKYQLAEMLAS